MSTSTSFSADTIRVINKTTGRGMWLVIDDTGTLTTSEVNSDRRHCPALLVDPIVAPLPAVFVTGVQVVATFQFDGLLGVGSSVSVMGLGTIASISLVDSWMTFQYTAANDDVLKFNVKSADGAKTARRVFKPATITYGPDYVPGSLTRTLFTDDWPASATLQFNRPLATVGGVTLVSATGVTAGTLSYSLSGSTLTLTNIKTTPLTAMIRIPTPTDAAGYSTPVIDVGITRQAATKPTLTSISRTAFTYGVEAYTDLVFNETLSAFTPTIDGVGATATTTWVPGQSSARVFIRAASNTTSVAFAVKDSNDGGADTITSSLTIVAPTQPALQSISTTSFITGMAVTGIVATFDRAVQSVASLTVASGGTATVTAISGTSVTFAMTATAVASPGYLFFNSVVSTENSVPVTLSASFTAAAPTQPTLSSISLTSFAFGIQAFTDLVFSETLQTLTPTINGTGATVTTTWTPGQSSARLSITAASDTTTLTLQIVDNNDGGASTITRALTIVSPPQPILQSISVSSFTTDVLVTGIVATFDRSILSVASLSLASGGTATVTSISGSSVTFSMTATAAANPGSLSFNGVVSTQNSTPITRSISYTATAPTVQTPNYYLDASVESSFTYNPTSKLITAISQAATGMTYQKIAGAWKANSLNGKGVIDFLGILDPLASSDMRSTFTSGNWTISYLVKAAKNAGVYTAGTQMSGGTARIDSFVENTSFYDMVPFTINGSPPEAFTKKIVMGNWYLFTTTRSGSSTSYYINDQYVGGGGQGDMGNLQLFTLNGYHPGGGNATQSAFAEVRMYTSGMDNASVGILYQTVKAKWGL